ncbi:hypothetical protein Peur_040071 [Populus x canadensis]
MPRKMAKLCRGKAVIVSVYEERPGKRRVSSSSNSHHHHYVHHVIKQEVTLHKNGDSRKGYSRRAELLHYSRRLRESALSATSSPSVPKPISSNKHHHQPTTNIVAAPSKPRFSRSTSPTCLGNWKILIPNICRSLTSIQAKQKKKKKHSGSTSNAMITVMKSLEVQKKKGFSLKLLSKLRRHR